MKVLVTPTSLNASSTLPAMDKLRAAADEIVFNTTGGPMHAIDLIPLLADVDGVVAGLDDYTAEVINAAGPKLKVISRYGVGSDRVDVAAAAARGIAVKVTPGANAVAVAELALGLMFGLARSIPSLDRAVRAGGWPRSKGMELTGKSLGIVGVGAIGRELAKRAEGIGMTVLGFDPVVDAETMEAAGIKPVTMAELLASSDIVSLHVPLLDSTRHIIDTAALASMKRGALLVNTARGGLIDEEAAYAALNSGQLAGLALDAYEVEPPAGSRLFELDSVIATPHTGAHTDEATAKMAQMA
ncbi:MAG: phosphoglycerate dehydrogenase, partial [Propionibacteriaceae bacterium]|nr:phosphoglycerate dehydrogenase [Propionibacteriaceae bacterium]